MAIVTITRRLQFNAAHRVHNPALSDAENKALFGKCNNPNWHGHNYTLDVSVSGPVDDKTGYVVDLSHIKRCRTPRTRRCSASATIRTGTGTTIRSTSR